MIKLNTISIHLQGATGGLTTIAKLGPYAYVSPSMIATVSPVEKPTENGLDGRVKCIVKCFDAETAYRLYAVENTAEEVVRARRREMNGEDSDSIDFNDFYKND